MAMNFKNKTIGIWGFGRVGKSAARFFTNLKADILLWDDAKLPSNSPYPCTQSFEDLLTLSDYILPSPGIDSNPYRKSCPDKWINELDIFNHFFTKKIIAITGTIGKTTVTSMLTESLNSIGWHTIAAGNIGLPCFDIIENQDQYDAVVLEVSSFQLEHCKTFKPDLAIWTNFFPNHLDRHKTIENYFDAKYKILAHQTNRQKAVINDDLKIKVESLYPKADIHYFVKKGLSQNKEIVSKAVLLLSGKKHTVRFSKQLEHRCEKVVTSKGITFINDSKSTTPQSTLAAIEEINAKRILLFLGGLSKGIDRSILIQRLHLKPIVAFCFGKEARELHTMCKEQKIQSYQFSNLQYAFDACIKKMTCGDCVLFSPSGSSFDLFCNYEERGVVFKQLVKEYLELNSLPVLPEPRRRVF